MHAWLWTVGREWVNQWVSETIEIHFELLLRDSDVIRNISQTDNKCLRDGPRRCPSCKHVCVCVWVVYAIMQENEKGKEIQNSQEMYDIHYTNIANTTDGIAYWCMWVWISKISICVCMR